MANNLTLTSATYDSSTAKFGQALNGGYGTGPVSLLNSFPFTVEIWFKATSNPSSTQILMGQSHLFYMGITPAGKLELQFGGGSTLGTSYQQPPDTTTIYTDGAWHHVALSASTTGGGVWLIDGAVQASFTAGQIAALTPDWGPLGTANSGGEGFLGIRTHGGEAAGAWQFTVGEVDEAAVWNFQKYTGAITPPTSAYSGGETGLVALWHLDGNGNDSTNAGGASTYTLSGPSSGTVGSASSYFTVQASGTLSASVTVTPSDSSGGGTFTPTSVTLAAGSNTSATFTYTATSAGTKTISTTNSGVLTNPGAVSYVASVSSAVTISPASPAIVYSPYTWYQGKTINGGAYFRTLFTGATLELDFDMSALVTPYPQIWVQIDGQAWQQLTLAATVTPTMPTTTANWQKHTLEVVVKAVSDGGTVNKWSPQASAVALTAIKLAAGGAVSAPATQARNVLYFGDSITAGNYVNQNGDTDGSCARNGWAYISGRTLLGAEVGIVGMSAQGLTHTGQGGVPVIGSTYNLLWSGQARSFTPNPDLIVINQGTNDGGASSGTFQAAYVSLLQALLGATTSCPIVCMRPFNGTHAADIQAAMATVSNARLVYMDTTGFFDTTLSVDGTHPYGCANISAIAPAVASQLTGVLNGTLLTYSGGFRRVA